ncbi:hypothetical protein KDK_62340 [Dictyobacter kobayashii]|uniref:Uncharacterized protein n=1 Tax=Dictyobacter kobayashii TaxID=2014872 RepID=A0A402ATL8_9CHLR|nr:hypothetical protein KDK_62340 [Dictyobacter kobayashii]
MIASCCTENSLHIWDAQTGANQCVCQHPYTGGQLQGLVSNALAWDTAAYAENANPSLTFASGNRVVSRIEIVVGGN